MWRFLFVSFLLFMFSSCERTETVRQDLKVVYDLEPFLTNEAARLEGMQVEKTTEAETKKEVQAVYTIDNGKAELSAFDALLLQGNPYRSSFTVDTLQMSYDACLLTYLTTEKKCALKRMEIFISGGEVNYIYAVKKSNNLFYDAESRFYYDRNNGYKVEGKDSFSWFKALDHSWSVRVQFKRAR